MLILTIFAATLAASPAAQTAPASPAAGATAEDPMSRPVEKVLKNIQVLNGMPLNQLAGTMTFIATSLGVQCLHCHESSNYALDTKPAKVTARKMIRMVLGLKNDTFGGRLDVTCYTCHRGSLVPAVVPSLDPVDWRARENAWQAAPAPSAPVPSAEQVLAKFVEASGGRAALTKHATRSISGTEVQNDGKQASFEMVKRAPSKYVDVTTTIEDGKPSRYVQGFDGERFWVRHDDRKGVSIWTPETTQIRRDGELSTPLELLAFGAPKVVGLKKNGARQAWVVTATAREGRDETLFFDTSSGLLVQRTYEIPTYLGALAYAIDYDDYRDVDGAKIPHRVKWSQARDVWTDTVTEVKNDVDAPDDLFTLPKPPEPAKAEPTRTP